MTSVDTLSSLSGTAASSTASATRDRLGQKDFLELMLAQVRNQDPLKPLDGAQFIGQLSASLASLAESMRSDQMLAGTALVGREVLMQSSDAVLEESGEVRGAIEVPEGVQQVLITVRDAAGQIVRQMNVSAGTGLVDFRWDGLTGAGHRAPPGAYSLGAIATGGGQSFSLPTLTYDAVRSVTRDTTRGSLVLNTGHHGAVPLADVLRIG